MSELGFAPATGSREERRDAIARFAAEGSSNETEVSLDELPTLFSFNGEPGLRSIEVLDPHHLDAVFGPGVSIESAVVQITTEPVTRGIEGALPFLKDPNGPTTCVVRPDLMPAGRNDPNELTVNPKLGKCPTREMFRRG
jgi:hypothetical protein